MSLEKFFDTGKVKINYLDYGSSSAEPLVMLHGGAWCWQGDRAVCEAKGAKACVAYDAESISIEVELTLDGQLRQVTPSRCEFPPMPPL